MTRLILLLALLSFVSGQASAQSCSSGLTAMGGVVCLTVDTSCDANFSMNGETCLLSQMFAANAACEATGVSFSGNCIEWSNPDAPDAASAREQLELYAGGSSPAAQACSSGLTAGTSCMQLNTTCNTGLVGLSGACVERTTPDPSCEGTGVRVADGAGLEGGRCLEWTNRNAPDAVQAEAVVSRLADGESMLTAAEDLPPGFGQLPPHLLPACMDGLDNDGDGNADYPADNGCTSVLDHEETSEEGENEYYHAFESVAIDSDVQMASLEYCQPSNAEQLAADRKALQDFWYVYATQNDLVPHYNYLAEEQDPRMALAGQAKREYSFSEAFPPDQEWRNEVDFGFGWGSSMSIEVNVICNAMGLIDVRSWGGSVTDPTWGPFDSEENRAHVADPDVRVTDYARLRSSYLSYFRPTPAFFQSAEVVYLTPDFRHVVQVLTRSNSGGYAARMNGPEGWRMVASEVSIGPWDICTSIELTEPASDWACDH